jgi:hypothetical protein
MLVVKSDISQFEHLIILLLFTGVILLSGNEKLIITTQQHIDRCLGFYDVSQSQNESHSNSDSDKLNQIKCILNIVKNWLIKDYKSSQCRKWVKWIKNKGMIIFSS